MSEKALSNNRKTARVHITLRGKGQSIYISKDAIRLIGTPRYITLRVNSAMDSLLIEESLENNRLSFKVPDDLYSNRNSKMQIASKSFVSGMMTSNALDPDETYIVEGMYSERNNAIVFSVKDARIYREGCT